MKKRIKIILKITIGFIISIPCIVQWIVVGKNKGIELIESSIEEMD